MPIKTNKLICGDTEYELTYAYREGALALRAGISFNSNPYQIDNLKHDEWAVGHSNESEGEHMRFSIDVITAPLTGRTFQMEPAVARDKMGIVVPV